MTLNSKGLNIFSKSLTSLLLFIFIFNIMILYVNCFANCPSVQIINSLMNTSLLELSKNGSDVCECTQMQEGGWEITCYSPNTNSDIYQPEFAEELNIIPFAFFIRYEIGRQLKITCDNGVPLFRPALFQGFGIESIDSFSFVNCPLPITLPLSVILHRTSIENINLSVNESELLDNDSNYRTNKTPKISKVRSLSLISKESVSVKQLNNLLTGLESIEQLKLSQFQLIDIVNYTIDTPLDIFEESINVENGTKPLQTNQTRNLVFSEEIFKFGQNFPNLKILRLQSFVKELVPGLMFEMLKGLTTLEYLELESNNLGSLPESAFSYAGNSLKKLYLYQNFIKNININAFANLSQLEILDLSHNELTDLSPDILKDLKNLIYFSVKNNLFSKLPETLFQFNTKLNSIDLSSNRNLAEFPENLLKGLQSLANFSAAYCQLTKLSERPQIFFRNAINLETIEIQGNLIRNITNSDLFSGNPKLLKIDLSFNNLTKISGNIFNKNSSNIIEITFYRNQIDSLPENIFSELRNLRKLNFGFNELTEISPQLFLSLKNLEELNLSKNKIKSINSKQNQIPFGLGANLRKVNLAYNELTDFDSDFNSINWGLYLNIAELDLRFNKFVGKLLVPVFSSSIAPIINLDLSSNGFTSVDVQNIISYDKLSLDHNNSDSRRTRDSSITTNIWETHIRLDNNPINCDCFLEPFLDYAKNAIMRSSYPSRSSGTTYRKTLFLIESEDLICEKPDHLIGYPLDSLDLSQLICQIDDQNICPAVCDCIYRSSDGIAIIDCDHRSLESLPQELVLSRYLNISLAHNSSIETVSGVILQLKHNQIKKIENINQMFIWGNKKIKKPSFVEIYLDNNTIVDIHEDIIPQFYSYKNNSLPLIRILSLKNNQISSVPLSVLKIFDSFASHLIDKNEQNLVEPKLYLGNNPFNCNNERSPPGSKCQIRDFKSWLSSHIERVGDINSIKCDKNFNYNSSSIIIEIPDDVLCPVLQTAQNDTILLTLTIVCILLAMSLFVVSILYYRNKQTILAFIYIHFNPIFICLSFSEEDLDEDKLYDAFVSYSSADRDVVMNLIEKLERPNNEANLILHNTTGASIHEGLSDQIIPENEFKKSQMSLSLNQTVLQSSDEDNHNNYFKLCIHERDWLPGNLISWNIVNSVQNSKRTILVLSKEFIESIWFQVEFHTAYYQMLEDKIDRLIIIVKGPLPKKEELDKDLVFLLTTKTYLVWGEKWFWEKLHYALPHKKLINDFKSVQNVRSATSSKLNGVSSVTTAKNGINNKSTEAMKDYVDKTIANHFQLKPISSTDTKTPPKSLRNSSQLSQPNSRLKNGFENRSFIIETQT